MISDGCRLKTLRDSQRRAPLTEVPTPGMSTMVRRIIVATNISGAKRCQVATGMRKVNRPTTSEITMNSPWRSRK
jgi:hypothetical protein